MRLVSRDGTVTVEVDDADTDQISTRKAMGYATPDVRKQVLAADDRREAERTAKMADDAETARVAAETRAQILEAEEQGYNGWTVAELRDEIRARNENRPDDAHLRATGNKAELVEALEADDATDGTPA